MPKTIVVKSEIQDKNLVPLCRNLQKARKAAKLTQEELARAIGVSRETVNAIENVRPSTVNSLELLTLKKWKMACSNIAGRDVVTVVSHQINEFLQV